MAIKLNYYYYMMPHVWVTVNMSLTVGCCCRMLFEMTSRKWYTTNVTLSFTAKNGSMEMNETNVDLVGDFLFAPTGHSYHCGIDMTLGPNKTANSSSTSTVTLTGLQVGSALCISLCLCITATLFYSC